MGNKCCRGAPPVGPPEHLPVERIFRHYDKDQSGYWEWENFVAFAEELLGYTSRKKQRQLWQNMVACVHDVDDPSELADVAFAKVQLDEFRSYMMINQHPEYVRNLVRIFNEMLMQDKTEEKYKSELQPNMEKSPKSRAPESAALDSLPSNADVDIMTRGPARRSVSVSPASARSRRDWRESRPGSPVHENPIRALTIGVDQINRPSNARAGIKSPRLRLGVGGLAPIRRSPQTTSRTPSVSPGERARRKRLSVRRHSRSSQSPSVRGDEEATEVRPRQAPIAEMKDNENEQNNIAELEDAYEAVAAREVQTNTEDSPHPDGGSETKSVEKWMQTQLAAGHKDPQEDVDNNDDDPEGEDEIKVEIIQGENRKLNPTGSGRRRRSRVKSRHHNRELTRDREFNSSHGIDSKHTRGAENDDDEVSDTSTTMAAQNGIENPTSALNLSAIQFPLRLNKLLRGRLQQRWLTVNNGEIFYSKSKDPLLNDVLLDSVKARLSDIKYAKWKKLKDPKTSICWIPRNRTLSIEIGKNGMVTITTRSGPSRKTKIFQFDAIGVSNDALVKEFQKASHVTRSAHL
mmetsp:Transcript_419/g.717  ORF Transcript_419/g.717 Transcript_419/m.717 type:complete len:575 (+) Transcript_419:43-1767(+)